MNLQQLEEKLDRKYFDVLKELNLIDFGDKYFINVFDVIDINKNGGKILKEIKDFSEKKGKELFLNLYMDKNYKKFKKFFGSRKFLFRINEDGLEEAYYGK